MWWRKVDGIFWVIERYIWLFHYFFNFFLREAYSDFHITHLTLAYNIAELQHAYKRRLVYKDFNILFIFENIVIFSELNLRIWQQSKKMFEETGKRPVVYNNWCGQVCGVRKIYWIFFILNLWIILFLISFQRCAKEVRLFFFLFWNHFICIIDWCYWLLWKII